MEELAMFTASFIPAILYEIALKNKEGLEEQSPSDKS
jgi:hypothetical protein